MSGECPDEFHGRISEGVPARISHGVLGGISDGSPEEILKDTFRCILETILKKKTLRVEASEGKEYIPSKIPEGIAEEISAEVSEENHEGIQDIGMGGGGWLGFTLVKELL